MISQIFFHVNDTSLYIQLCKPETDVIFDISNVFTLHLENSANFTS